MKGIHNFGVFLEILPGAEDGSYPGLEGLCHVSNLAIDRIRNCEAWMKSMGAEELEVMYMGVKSNGKIELSRKAVLEQRAGKGKKRPPQEEQPAAPPAPEMSEEGMYLQYGIALFCVNGSPGRGRTNLFRIVLYHRA